MYHHVKKLMYTVRVDEADPKSQPRQSFRRGNTPGCRGLDRRGYLSGSIAFGGRS